MNPLTSLDIENTSEFLLSKYITLLSEINTRLNEFIHTYHPHEKQKLFHESRKQIRIMKGGNRSGKTRSAVYEVLSLAMGEHPWIKLDHPANIWVIGLDMQNMVTPILIPEIVNRIPERYVLDYNKNNKILKLTNGTIITFKSQETTGGQSKFQSAEVDLVWFDEEPLSEEIYEECYARTVSCNGHIIITMTPAIGGWTNERFFSPFKEGILNDVDFIEVSTYDNIFLPKGAADKLLEGTKSDEEKRRRLYGDYVDTGSEKVFADLVIALDDANGKNRYEKEPLTVVDTFFDRDGKIAVSDEISLSKHLSIWEFPHPHENYIAGCDTSEGIKDPTCIEIFKIGRKGDDEGKLIQVAEYTDVIYPEIAIRKAYEIMIYYNSPFLNIERNGVAFTIIHELKDVRKYNNLYLRTTDEASLRGEIISPDVGTHMDYYSKTAMVIDFRKILSDNKIVIRSKELLKEMIAYSRKKNKKIEAAYGHDDRVIGTMLAVSAYMSTQTPIKRTFELGTPTERRTQDANSNQISNWVAQRDR